VNYPGDRINLGSGLHTASRFDIVDSTASSHLTDPVALCPRLVARLAFEVADTRADAPPSERQRTRSRRTLLPSVARLSELVQGLLALAA
jgi:hypothetical protein